MKYQEKNITIEIIHRHSSIAIIAPHGGNIETGTAEIARYISGNNYSFYSFNCLGNIQECKASHIPSHKFNEPKCIDLLNRTRLVITIHGMHDESDKIIVGGLYDNHFLVEHFVKLGFCAESGKFYHRISGTNPDNICNKGKLKKGVQLEIGSILRILLMNDENLRTSFKKAIDEFIIYIQKSRP